MRIGLGIVLAVGLLAGFLFGGRHQSAANAPAAKADAKSPTPAATPSFADLTPMKLIPADALLAWKGMPPGDERAEAADAGQPDAFRTLLDAIGQIGQLRPQTQLWLGIFDTFGLVVKHPFALALLDAKAVTTASGKGKQLSDAKVAIIADFDGEFAGVRRKIQALMNDLTDQKYATLEKKRVGELEYQELTDKRLGFWNIAWGAIGDHFVITFGPAVWPEIAETALGKRPSLAADPWLKDARAKQSPEPLIEIVSQSQAIRERLDPLVEGRASAFFKAWESSDIERAYWALGFEGPAMYCLAEFDGDKGTRRKLYADPRIKDPRYLATIPDGSHYAIYRLPVQWLLPKLFAGYYATQDPSDRLAAEKLFAKIQADNGFDADKDLLAHLGDTIILHNYPQHPLHLPLAFTCLMEIRGDAKRVRKTIDAVCEAWRDAMDEASAKNTDLRPAMLDHESDGLWYFQYAMVSGVAWTVTDKYLITSWSPKALRDYLREAGSKVGTVIP